MNILHENCISQLTMLLTTKMGTYILVELYFCNFISGGNDRPDAICQ